MRLVKLTLLGLIVASLTMMWSNRDFVVEAYQPTPNTLQVRLSGVDLAVTRSAIEPSPFLIPAAPDTRRATLPALTRPEPSDADPLPPVEMTGGESRLNGTVVGPDGPVPGASVAIERHTSHGIGTLLVTTDEAGTWTAGRLPGGRYRVRAWLPGLMTTGGSEVRYVAEKESAEFTFSMWGVDPTPSLEFVHGGAIYESRTGEVAVVLSRRYVDDEGIVVTAPIAGGLITVEVTSEVTIASSPVQLTGSDGVARFTLSCTAQLPVLSQNAAGQDGGAQGAETLTASSGSLSASFALPGCRPLPTPAPIPVEPSGSPGTHDSEDGATSSDGADG